MKIFEQTTVWCKLELCFDKDEDFIEQFEKIFNFYEHEYNPKAEMKFYVEIKGEDIWVEISREDGMAESYKLLIDSEEVEFDEDTAESILDAIKKNLIK